jgi:hypothetical protein
MFPDVVDEEGVRFIDTVSKAQGIGLSVIREFVTRTLLRIAYGISLYSRRLISLKGSGLQRSLPSRFPKDEV